MTTVMLGQRTFPCGGGGYFRLFPYALSRWALRRVNQRDGESAVFYFHPWEIDPEQPRQSGIGLKTRVRHYLNLSRTEARLSQLLRDFAWDRMDAIFLQGAARPARALGQDLDSRSGTGRMMSSTPESAAVSTAPSCGLRSLPRPMRRPDQVKRLTDAAVRHARGHRCNSRHAHATEAAWDAFVEQCPDATFFHRAGWRRILEESLGHRAYYLYSERAGAITGVLPLGQVKSLLFGNALISVPFCVYGGVAAQDAQAAASLTAAACALAEELEVDYLELRHRERRNPDWPCKDDLYVTFRKAIEPEPEKNLQAIPRKQRAWCARGSRPG